jgi:hypothetical protein
MAFDKLNMAPVGASLTNRDVPTLWSYITTDTLAVTKASAYFNNIAGLLTNNDYMYLGCSDGADMVIVTSANGATPVTVAAFITAGDLSADAVETIHIKDANVTTAKILDANVTAAKLAPDSVTTVKILDDNVTTAKILDANVTTAKILDANVTLAKLAAGITPSHVVKFADDSFTTLGGAAAEVITVTGVLATDVVHVTMREQGAAPQTILKAVPTTDTITVTFSGDPSTDHVVAYSVLRAAA